MKKASHISIKDVETIEKRLQAVQSLLDDKSYFSSLKNVLKQFDNLEDIVLFCFEVSKKQVDSSKSAEHKIQGIWCMRKIAQTCLALKALLEKSNIPLLQDFYKVDKNCFSSLF